MIDGALYERLMSRSTVTPDGCWLWDGCLDRWGYGKVKASADAMTPGLEAMLHLAAPQRPWTEGSEPTDHLHAVGYDPDAPSE